jgi:hypothetical protein
LNTANLKLEEPEFSAKTGARFVSTVAIIRRWLANTPSSGYPGIGLRVVCCRPGVFDPIPAGGDLENPG